MEQIQEYIEETDNNQENGINQETNNNHENELEKEMLIKKKYDNFIRIKSSVTIDPDRYFYYCVMQNYFKNNMIANNEKKYFQLNCIKNRSLRNISIPPGTTHLNIDEIHNQSLRIKSKNYNKSIIPYGITHLILPYDFTSPLNEGDIPNTVQNLYFGSGFNCELKPNDIPNSVKVLHFGSYFCKPINNNNIPSSVIELVMKNKDNRNITHIIPNGIKKLVMDNTFNDISVGTIPNTVTRLTLPDNFNKPLQKGIIPEGVIELTFGNEFDQQLKIGDIPNSIKKLNLGNKFNQKLSPGIIPEGIVELTFSSYFNKILYKGDIPNTVKKIKFGDYFNQPLIKGFISKGVEEIYFGCHFNRPLYKDTIPDGVKSIIFNKNSLFNQVLNKNDLPNTITKLYFGDYYNTQLFSGCIPNSIKYLRLGKNFDQMIQKGALPEGLISLIFDGVMIDKIEELYIPDSVMFLRIPQKFKFNSIPKNLKYISIPHEFVSNFNGLYANKKNIQIQDFNIDQATLYFTKMFREGFNMKNLIVEVFKLNGFYYDSRFIFDNNIFSCKNINLGDKILKYFNDFVEFNLTIKKDILKELTEKVFAPERLLKICNEYNLTFEELMDIY